MIRSVVSIAFVIVAATYVADCSQPSTRQDDAQTAPATNRSSDLNALRPVLLPDLSGLAESVQRQIRERHTQLVQTIDRHAAPGEQAAAYGALGRLLMAAKFNEEAASCFLHAEALAPSDMRWPYYAGHAYWRKGERPRAAAAFERALKLRPNELAPLVWLGETYLDDDRLDLARTTFQRALSVDGQSAAALFGAGRTALANRQYTDAAQLLERALAVDGRASAIHYPLAMAYRALGDQQKSDAHLRQRGTAYPDLPDPLMQQDEDIIESAVSFENRGMQALKGGDFESAVASFRKGLELAPDDVSLRYWLGAALYAAGDAAGAEREFAAVVRRDPKYAKAHFSLGAIADERKDRRRAIEAYRAAVRADPNLPEARLRLAEALRASGQIQASIEHYEAAVTLDPGMAEAWIGGAQALIDSKQIEKARDWLVRARRIFPNRREWEEMGGRLK